MKYWIIGITFTGVLLVLLLRWLVPSIVFQPTREVSANPAALGLDYENVRLQTADGENIAAWYIPAVLETSPFWGKLTVLFFHGNAGNMSHRLESIAFFHKLGLSVFIIDYRGYGESTGKPSVSGTIQDGLTAWQWLIEHKKVPPANIILFGRSLGGGVAAALAPQISAKALVLESTFTSLHAMGNELLPWVPKCLFSADYETLENIRELQIPILVVHSSADEVINYRMGQEIFDSYTGPKSFLQLNGSHNSGWFTDAAVYEKGIRAFLEKIISGS